MNHYFLERKYYIIDWWNSKYQKELCSSFNCVISGILCKYKHSGICEILFPSQGDTLRVVIYFSSQI